MLPEANLDDRRVDVAVEYVLEAERSHRVRNFLIGDEWSAVLALRAASLAEFVCAFNLALADRQRQEAASCGTEAERRRPSGRKVHTTAESQELLDSAARHSERADTAEAAALSVIGVSDLAAAHLAVAHMSVAEAVARSGPNQLEWSAALAVAKRVRTGQKKQREWLFVKGRAAQSPQTRGGLLPLTLFDRHDLGGAVVSRHTESGPLGTISSAVELIARWDLSGDPRAEAEPSVAALEAIRGVRRGEHTESGIGRAAAILRPGEWNDDALDELEWEGGGDDETLAHIAEMRARVSRWFERFDQPVHPGIWKVHSERFRLDGHIDFVTPDAIWDLKVSGTVPDRVDILQLLLYWIAFLDDPDSSLAITHVGFFNPRMDVAWRVAVADIPRDVVGAVETIALSEYPGAGVHKDNSSGAR